MTDTPPPNEAPDRAALDRRIQLVVGASALRKIRQLVTECEEEDRLARRTFRVAMAMLALLAIGIGIAIYANATRSRAIYAPPGQAHSAENTIVDEALSRYVDAWQLKMQQVAAKEWKWHSDETRVVSCVLTVSIRSDGSLEDARIGKRSASREFDDAVLALAKKAAPLEAFSNKLQQKMDVLHITKRITFATELVIQ